MKTMPPASSRKWLRPVVEPLYAEPLFSRLPECEPAGTIMGATMSQSGSQWFRMAGHRKIPISRMVAGVRWEPVAWSDLDQ